MVVEDALDLIIKARSKDELKEVLNSVWTDGFQKGSAINGEGSTK
jgi:hypothetical protein